jgi:hypothetical protein
MTVGYGLATGEAQLFYYQSKLYDRGGCVMVDMGDGKLGHTGQSS